MKSSKVICCLVLLTLICIDSFAEGRSKIHRTFKRIGKAVEKVGKKTLEDGTVSKVILAGAIGRKRRSVRSDDESVRHLGHIIQTRSILRARP